MSTANVLNGARYEPDDVVVAILVRSLLAGCNMFKSQESVLHPLFFSFRSNPRFSRFFHGFIFDTCDYFPFSETLEDILFALEFAGHLDHASPGGAYLIYPAIRQIFDRELLGKFSEPDIRDISDMAHDFIEKAAVR